MSEESGMHEESQPLLSDDALKPEGRSCRSKILASFFALGAGSSITFNSIVMAVAYFKKQLGNGILREVAVSHDAALLVVLVALVFLVRVPARLYGLLLMASLLVGISLNAFVVVAVASDVMLNRVYFELLVGINGVATGLLQGLAASLSGQFDPYSAVAGAGSMQLSGVGFGVLVPCLLQSATLPFAAQASSDAAALRRIAAIGAIMSAGVAAVACIAAAVGARFVLSTNLFKIILDGERSGQQEVSMLSLQGYSVGQLLKLSVETYGVVSRRVVQVAPYIIGEFINEASIVFIMLVTPLLPVASGSSPFWKDYLATILLITCNLMSFGGRMLATSCSMTNVTEEEETVCTPDVPLHLTPQRRMRRKALSLAVLLAPLPAVLCYLYSANDAKIPMLPESNTWIILLYGASALASGYSIVAVSEESQAACGFTHATPCPVVSQLIYLCLTLGALVATILCFAVVR